MNNKNKKKYHIEDKNLEIHAIFSDPQVLQLHEQHQLLD